MLQVKKGNISITRGDSAYISLPINGYTISEGDSVSVQVRRGINRDTDLLFDGDIAIEEDGSITWHIHPEDTDGVQEGDYYWDAQLTTASGDKYTYIAEKTFTVRPDSTNK